MVRELVNYGANVNAQSQVEWPGLGWERHPACTMVVSSWWELCPAHGHFSSPLQFLSSAVQGRGLLCQTPERRHVCEWWGGSLKGYWETSTVSLLRESMAAHTNKLNSSWENSWMMPP